MKPAAAILSAAVLSLLTVGSPAVAQDCPIGSYPWVDNWGNKICKRHGDGSTATIETPRAQTCPTGSYPWVDNWGNKVCRTHDTPNQPRADYYDTSKGCPVGTLPGVDQWGNKTCKKF